MGIRKAVARAGTLRDGKQKQFDSIVADFSEKVNCNTERNAMSYQYDRLVDMIKKQQAGHENKPRFTIGEQLKGMAKDNDHIADLLIADLGKTDLSLEAAEKMLAAYAGKHRGNAREYCITPTVADKLLRDMYGLPEEEETPKGSGIIDLDSFF